jgi:hypothetical protein
MERPRVLEDGESREGLVGPASRAVLASVEDDRRLADSGTLGDSEGGAKRWRQCEGMGGAERLKMLSLL